MKNVYEVCPTLQNDYITLKQTTLNDAEELLKCYSDIKAVPFFNSDNCHGDDFHYTSLERMKQAIEFWNYSYNNRHFVRWTIILNSTNEIIGTIEMFHRIAEDDFNHYGVLRIDLQSKFENQKVI
ncbi:MAG TPA: N-acetyltransferase, partial [Clostridia bacterium]